MQNSPENFFDTWGTYQKVLANNHMFHRELGKALQSALHDHFQGRPISILDLGCGDTSALMPTLQLFAITRYKGIDLSETALALAGGNLAALPCPVELMQGDILGALAKEKSTYDLIHCSFALHHFATREKAEFFKLSASKMKDHGLLVIADVVREENETLPLYHERYCAWLRGNFTTLSEDEKGAICDHITRNDFPEPLSVLTHQAEEAGLRLAFPFARFGWHWLLVFARSS